jgi:hypothetical protein
MPVPEQWTCPRVGQYVRLNSGAVGEVILVRKAREILRTMTEGGALWLVANAKASYGQNWIDTYYEADIIVGGMLTTITPRQVAAIVNAA